MNFSRRTFLRDSAAAARRMIDWATSVQMTASMPPKKVTPIVSSVIVTASIAVRTRRRRRSSTR